MLQDLERRITLLERQVDVHSVALAVKAESANVAELGSDLAVLCEKVQGMRSRLRLVLYHLAYIASLAAAIFAGVIRFGLIEHIEKLVG